MDYKCSKCGKIQKVKGKKPYMVVTKKGKKYYGSWHDTKGEAEKFGRKLGTKYIVTSKPKKYYKF